MCTFLCACVRARVRERVKVIVLVRGGREGENAAAREGTWRVGTDREGESRKGRSEYEPVSTLCGLGIT